MTARKKSAPGETAKEEPKIVKYERRLIGVRCKEGVMSGERLRQTILAKDVESLAPHNEEGIIGFLVANKGRAWFVPAGMIAEVLYERAEVPSE